MFEVLAVKYSRKEVTKAFENNDVALVAKMLEDFGISKGDDARSRMNPCVQDLVLSMLKLAAAAVWRDELSEEMANELIERLSPLLNIFDFIHPMARSVKAENYDLIPADIKESLVENVYSDQIAGKIEELDKEAFEALLPFMVSELERINRNYCLPITRGCLKHEIVPRSAFFTFMGCSFYEPENTTSGFTGMMAGLSGFNSLMTDLLELLSSDDESSTDNKDAEASNNTDGDSAGDRSDNNGAG